jgi:hypothetical protein
MSDLRHLRKKSANIAYFLAIAWNFKNMYETFFLPAGDQGTADCEVRLLFGNPPKYRISEDIHV